MDLIKKILGGGTAAFGGLFLLAALIIPFDKSAENRGSAFIGCLILGLPTTAAGIALFRSGNSDQRQAKEQSLKAEQAELRRVFYQLIQGNNGQITLMQFAIAANIPANQAKEYLDQQTIAFNANFDSNAKGELIYQFPSSSSTGKALEAPND